MSLIHTTCRTWTVLFEPFIEAEEQGSSGYGRYSATEKLFATKNSGESRQ